MNEKVQRALNSYYKMTSTEKLAFKKAMNDFDNYPFEFQRDSVKKSLSESISVGPKNTICDCCGR